LDKKYKNILLLKKNIKMNQDIYMST